MEDTRNVVDGYKGQSMETIINDLDEKRISLEIAVENVTRDYNMGTIVRSANAFNVRKIHIIGSRQWNKRGAMKTDAYMHIEYHKTVDDFYVAVRNAERQVVAVDIVNDAKPLHEMPLPENAVLVFGAEGPGLSEELLGQADSVAFVEQFGSTRSINVGVAAGIAMYTWVQQHVYGLKTTR